ncbi:MAG: hypothetical protein ACRENP_20075 [Longimicrobiales bacterium]
MSELASGFAGAWNVEEATFPKGEFAYTGTINIEQNGSTFDLDWNISAGRYVGVGLCSDSHLYVSCGEQRAGLGIAVFQILSGSDISILWCTPEMRGSLGTGEFISTFNGRIEGEHKLIQYLPDGSVHGTWTVQVKRVDRTFELVWRKGHAIHFQGLGLEMPSGLAVSWYPDVKQLAILDYILDPEDRDGLSAVWALGGFSSLGTERLKRK